MVGQDTDILAEMSVFLRKEILARTTTFSFFHRVLSSRSVKEGGTILRSSVRHFSRRREKTQRFFPCCSAGSEPWL